MFNAIGLYCKTHHSVLYAEMGSYGDLNIQPCQMCVDNAKEDGRKEGYQDGYAEGHDKGSDEAYKKGCEDTREEMR